MMRYNMFFVGVALGLCSCEQVLRSAAEQSAKASNLRDSLAFEYNEKPISSTRVDTLERNISGTDTLLFLRGYFLNGSPYYECHYKNSDLHGVSSFSTSAGKLHYRMEYRNGKPVSLLNSYDLNGHPQDGGNLKNGTGSVKLYHPITGNLSYKAAFRNGLREGLAESFFSDGRKHVERTYKNDTAIGNYVEYYHSGAVREKGNLDMFSVSGTMTSFYPGGKQKESATYENGVQMSYTEHDENGYLVNEIKLTGDRYIGTKYYYTPEGKLLSKGQMFNNLKHGNYEYFYESGKRKTLEVYSNDTLLAETIWNESGTLSVENVYRNGKKNGICKEYYITGHIRVEQMYVDDVEQGMYRSYFNSGQLYNEGRFKDGELTGDLKFYSEQGKLTNTKHYK